MTIRRLAPAQRDVAVAVLAVPTLLALLAGQPAAWAQQPPDAGSTLQDLRRPPPPPAERRDPVLPASAPDAVAPGGPTVLLRALDFEGNGLLDDATLAAALADAVGQRFDLAGLRALAARVDALYREAGYPFVRTVLPPQALDDGRLRLQVIEGRYGQVRARAASPADTEAAQVWVAPLRPGAPIAAAPLARATLLLDELPGVRSRAVLRPGEALGSGDLVVQVEREARWVGDASLDNHGNRYSGAWRLLGRVEGRGLWRLGDRLALDALASDQELQHGTLAYGLPLGADGWRGRVAATHTRYALGREFAPLGAQGRAQVLAAGIGLAPLRTTTASLSVQLEWQDKQLDDRQARLALRSRKRSQALPVTLRFDHRDASGRVQTWGALVLTTGRLRLDAATAAADRLRTAGAWQTLRVDAAQRHALGGGWSLQWRASGQWADRNLDASEGFSLGGAQGVRAYPAGEAPGDLGWLAQLELRRAVGVGGGTLEPFVFHDHGQLRPDRDSLPGTRAPTRRLAGSGVGLRAARGAWQLEAQAAWRTQGGPPQSVPGDGRLRLWLSLGRRF